MEFSRAEIVRLLERLEPPPSPEWVAATTKHILSQFDDHTTDPAPRVGP